MAPLFHALGSNVVEETEMPDGGDAKRGELFVSGIRASRDVGHETTRFNAAELRALVTRSTEVSGAFARGDLADDDRPTTIAPVPVVAPFVAPAIAPVVVHAEPHLGVDFEQNVLGRGYFRRRLVAVTLLAFVLLSQPWWWNVGDVRGATGRHANRNLPAMPSANAPGSSTGNGANDQDARAERLASDVALRVAGANVR